MLNKIKRHVSNVIRKSNIILEVVDARVPIRTRALFLEKRIKNIDKELILVINKSDLIPKSFEDKVKEILSKENIDYIFVSTKLRKNINKLKKIIKEKARKFNIPKVFVGVIGLVNTGKSSLINSLRLTYSARTSPNPGFTKGFQIFKLSSRIYLLDSPGVIILNGKDLISKLYNIKIRDYYEVALELINKILDSNPKTLQDVYKITIPQNSNPEVVIERIARRLNKLKKNSELDLNNVAQKIINDWHKGLLKAYWI